MTVAELFQWAFVRHWGERRTADLERYILRSHTILTIDMATTRLWARIRAAAHHKGTAISPQDAWVAAVSYTHLRAHETVLDLVCRLLLETKKNNITATCPLD